jgi:hypothetical protein
VNAKLIREKIMRQYIVKGNEGIETFVQILQEKGNSLDILITRKSEYSVKEDKDSISKDLFETCLRTGYLKAIRELRVSA